MSHVIDGVRAKLTRAKNHIDLIDGEVGKYLQTCKQAFLVDPNVEFIRLQFRISAYPDPSLSVLVGDCVHDMRSALDHIMCALWILSGKRDCEGTAGFPMYTGADHYKTARKSLVKSFTTSELLKALALIDKAQPTAPSMVVSSPKEHPLAILNKLSNVDKHRHLNFTVLQSANTFIEFQLNNGRPVRTPVPAPLVHGADIEYPDFRREDIDPNVQMKASNSPLVSFDESVGSGSKTVQTTLNDILYFISNFVVPGFEPILN